MGPEINAKSILALQRRIEEGKGDIIQLKRARNSLLNISTRVPPEIQGYIFRWNVIPVGDFDGLVKGSYNFVLVCHHWFQVASGTPELWSFWGNTFEQWFKRHQSSGTAPIDLVLDGSRISRARVTHDCSLQNALQDRTASSFIRSIRFRAVYPDTPTQRFLLSSLIPDGNDVRPSSIQSIKLHNVNLPEFFTRHHFPRLRHLDLVFSLLTTGLSWDHLSSRLTTLTTLSLVIEHIPFAPSTSQLIAMLASNPQLQRLSIRELAIKPPRDASPSLASLHHLKTLRLTGDPCTFRLLHHLDLPEALDNVDFTLLGDCRAEDVRRIYGPYLQDYLCRDSRLQDTLCIYLESTGGGIAIDVSTFSEADTQAPYQRERLPFASFRARLDEAADPGAMDKLFIELITHLPTEHVRCLRGRMNIAILEETISVMSNIEELHLVSATISDGFLQLGSDSTSPNAKLLPSLRLLCLEHPVADHDGWGPLLSYLTHQISGDQAISLKITGNYLPICPHVVESIRDLVRELVLDPPLGKPLVVTPFGPWRPLLPD